MKMKRSTFLLPEIGGSVSIPLFVYTSLVCSYLE